MGIQFAGKVALITGGGSGIGRATAVAFAREGAAVVVVGRRSDPLAETVRLIESAGGKAHAVTADVSRAAEIRDAVQCVADCFGALDIAFNNAGVQEEHKPTAEVSEEEWDTVISINLTGVWLSMKYEIQHMQGRGGVIINNGSILGPHMRMAGTSAYSASKAGVAALTRTAAREYTAQGIRINAISPGLVRSSLAPCRPGETHEERDQRLMERFPPITRVADPSEVAEAVLWLASPASGFAVGLDLVLDGGSTA